MSAMATSCCSSSSLTVQSIPSHGAIAKSTTASLKALPALPALRRSDVKYGVPGAVKDRRVARGPSALFGGGGAGDEKKKAEKKFITKEQEPDQYWATAAEKEGKNPMQTVLPYIALLTLLSPFAILAVAYANNWIKLPN